MSTALHYIDNRCTRVLSWLTESSLPANYNRSTNYCPPDNCPPDYRPSNDAGRLFPRLQRSKMPATIHKTVDNRTTTTILLPGLIGSSLPTTVRIICRPRLPTTVSGPINESSRS